MFEFFHNALAFVVLALVALQFISKRSFSLSILAISATGLLIGFSLHHVHVHSLIEPCWAYLFASAYAVIAMIAKPFIMKVKISQAK